ncbi:MULTISPECIES: cytochrome c [unclassified Gluconobacter]|uniref:c-type cytochrome n=1 Tax=unclassified Gluconobacter TaxID=2644261 RepID=UPI0017778B1D|nr:MULTISPECIES: cytochrome c [unclassified Gluconobacter]GFE97055.1 cytochrome c-552 [Gluconobacter sp. Gdi]
MIKRTVLVMGFLFGTAPIAHAEDGQALYSSKCSVCHQAAGIGSPGQFPPLSGRVGKIASSPEGKAYLTDVLLNGLHGAIDVSDETYMGFMPSFKALTDSQIAAVLTYVSSLNTSGKAPVFSDDEIKAARATPKKAKEIVSERAALNALHPLP